MCLIKKHFYAFEARLLASGSSTAVKYWTLHLTIKGLNPAAGSGKGKIIKDYIYLFHQKNIFMHLLTSCTSTVVEHWTLNLTIKGLNKAASTGREKMLVRFKLFVLQKILFDTI